MMKGKNICSQTLATGGRPNELPYSFVGFIELIDPEIFLYFLLKVNKTYSLID